MAWDKGWGRSWGDGGWDTWLGIEVELFGTTSVRSVPQASGGSHAQIMGSPFGTTSVGGVPLTNTLNCETVNPPTLELF